MTGHEYRDLIGSYLAEEYQHRELRVFREVRVGVSVAGKRRRVDLLAVRRDRALAIECKWQTVSGTKDEALFYALEDLRGMRMPGVLVYAGGGFSDGLVQHMRSSELAAYCLPGIPRGKDIDSGTWQLDHIIARVFGWWEQFTDDASEIQWPG